MTSVDFCQNISNFSVNADSIEYIIAEALLSKLEKTLKDTGCISTREIHPRPE